MTAISVSIRGDAVRRPVAVEWTDGIGDLADTCAVSYIGAPAEPGRGPITITSPDGSGGATYGAYDVIAHSVSGEERTSRVTGEIGADFGAELSDREDEAAIYSAILSAVAGYAAQSPWSEWLQAPADADYMRVRVAAELVRAETLGQARQVLLRWGLTLIATATASGRTVRHGVTVLPLYPHAGPSTGAIGPGGVRLTGTLDLTDAIIEATPAIDDPDASNLRGQYRTRQIVGMQRALGVIRDDPVLVSAGTLRPALYLRPSGDLIGMVLEAHIARWRLQNESQRLEMTVWRHEQMAGIVPQRIIRLSGDQTGQIGNSRWLVSQVRHRWDASRGYRAEVTATRWQGRPATVRPTTTSLAVDNDE